MMRLLKKPLTNALCLAVFTAFFSYVFFFVANSRFFAKHDVVGTGFWRWWRSFLLNNGQGIFAGLMILLSLLVVFLLLRRRKDYDEYHVGILLSCLAVSLVVVLIALAIFYLAIFRDPFFVQEKCMLFMSVNWATVVLADLTYVLICRWR